MQNEGFKPRLKRKLDEAEECRGRVYWTWGTSEYLTWPDGKTYEYPAGSSREVVDA